MAKLLPVAIGGNGFYTRTLLQMDFPLAYIICLHNIYAGVWVRRVGGALPQHAHTIKSIVVDSLMQLGDAKPCFNFI